MKILVSTTSQNYRKDDLSNVSRITTFVKNDEELERITMSLRVPFYVVNLKEKLERDRFMSFLNKLRTTEVKEVLDAEAAKFIKKKYNTDLDEILSLIIQIG